MRRRDGGAYRPLTRRGLLEAAGATAAVVAARPDSVWAQEPPRPLALINGKVITLDSARPQAPAVALRGGRVLAVGDNNAVREAAGPRAQVVDLGGRTVIPGLNDSHIHAVRGGRFYNTELRWDGVPSLARGLQMIAEQARRTPAGQWVRVIGGWSPYQFEERRFPTPEELSRASPDRPVFVLFLYSRGFLNRAGVEALKLRPNSKPPAGGRYEFTSGGSILWAEPDPTILYSAIAGLPELSDAEQVNSTRHFYRELNRFGLTSAIDAGGGGHSFPADYAGSAALAEAGEMPLRVSYYLFPQRPARELAEFTRWTRDQAININRAAKLEEGFVAEGVGEFLVWSAGDFENFAAPMPDITEREHWREELMDTTRLLLEARWPIRIHATYDPSITKIMDVFEAAHRAEVEAGRSGFRGIRWAIDHAETVSTQNLARIRALDGGIAIQDRMAFAGEFFAERYGEKAAAAAPPVRDMLEMGIPVGAGSDSTRVSSYNPWVSLWWLITGKTVGGATLRAPRHRLAREEALQLYTTGSAWFSGEEALKGRLKPGQFADLAVLSEDFLSVPEDAIKDIESVLTVVAGRPVHGAGAFSGLAPEMPRVQPPWSPVARFGGYHRAR